jgi:lysophospholipase L1-like esterase
VTTSVLRSLMAGIAASVAVSPFLGDVAYASDRLADHGRGWSGVWASAQHKPWHNEWDGPNWSLDGFADQSVRQVIRVTVGGARVRIRLSNRHGSAPLRVTGATLAKTADGAAVRPGTVRQLTFGRSHSATIPAGRDVTSDAAPLATAALEKLTITLYFAQPTGPATFHEAGMTTTYRASGDHRFDAGAGAFTGQTSHSWYYLAGVDVIGGPANGAVVAFGDSLTDGYGSTPGADNRYPDELAELFAAAGTPRGVLNAGIGGNMLLTDSLCGSGDRGLARFARDVLSQPGVRTVVVLQGTNDIGLGGLDFGCGTPPVATTPHLIDGHRALIQAAHAHGLKIIGATLPPLKGADVYDSKPHEAVRNALNHWIRYGGEYDAVVDLDRVLADPADPAALRAAYDSGDHLHPNDAGMKSIAAAIAERVNSNDQ